MGSVMVRCPATGHDIPTGIVTDRKSFAATPVFFARVRCPICRTEHEWFAKEAWVATPIPRRVRTRAWRRSPRLEHDSEKWLPVFGKDHASTIS
jgi:hypothetical protein